MSEKRVIKTNKAPKAIGPYSQGILNIAPQKTLFLSGQVGIDPKSDKIALCSEKLEEQTHQVMKNIEAVLKEAGFSLDDIVKSTIYLISMKDFAIVNEIYASYFSKDFPARSTIAVKALPLDALVEIECMASN